jgi:cytochrome P450
MPLKIIEMLNTLTNYMPAPSVTSLLVVLTMGVAALALYVVYLYVRLSRMKSVRPFEQIPTVPNVHWLLGHFPYFHTVEPAAHHSIFSAHSSPSGITGIWGDMERRAFTVLRADHVRAVLRQNSSRDPMKLITRHGAKTLGEESLILIPGGMRWKKQRSVVAKMFTVDVIRGGKKAVAECSQLVVQWLLHAVSPQAVHENCPSHDGKTVTIEAENLFKPYSLEVFGKVSMGYDFKCFENTMPQQGPHECGKKCNCLRMSTMATSFAFLQDDVAKRSQPQNVFNPKIQSYSLPTKYNRDYTHHSKVVRDMIGDIIGDELAKIMSAKNMTQVYGVQGKKGNECQDENLITHLLRFTLEDQFQLGHSSKPLSNLPRCPFSGSSKPTPIASGCPFAASSATLPHGNSDTFVPTSMTVSQKEETIDNVSSILRTLLMAGFETTATSLSYVVYFLSLHPRCQEICAQEAERVLGARNEDVMYNADFNPDDLVYCRAVFQETIRLHLPVIFTTRVLEKDMTFDTGNGDERVTVPKGTKALISPSAIHNDERNFERAKEFIPERWVKWDGEKWVDRNYQKEKKAATSSSPPASIYTSASHSVDQSPESISAADPQNFFSFSDGARNCVGKRVAILESSVMIGMLFRDFNVDLAEKNFKLETKRKFATVGPVSLPVVFRKR